MPHLNVTGVPLTVVPGPLDRGEQPVRMVKLAPLQSQEHGREGLQAEEVVQDKGRGGVVRAVVKGRDLKKWFKIEFDQNET